MYETCSKPPQQLDGYIPGQDYPVYHEIPQGLSFRCDQRLPGYYSDPEAQCQVGLVSVWNRFESRLINYCDYFRCGTGVCQAANNSASSVRTARSSISLHAFATGGSMWIVRERRICTESMRIFIKYHLIMVITIIISSISRW